MAKTYCLSSAEIRPLAIGRGSCIASDRITVDGKPVGFLYRERPDNAVDSGWRFFCGDETQDYADDANNFAIYDVNTIANYDPDIIAVLDADFGTAYARDDERSAFEAVPFPNQS